MMNYLQNGMALYVLAAICLMGMASKIMAGGLYKSWIRETENMALTKNKKLRSLKQRAEDTYRLNQGMSNTKAYLERQFYDAKLGMAKPEKLASFGTQMTGACFLFGGAASFLSYWYRSDSYYIVLYGSMGIMAGILNMIVDSGVNLSEKRNRLLVSIEDYLENSLFRRMERDYADLSLDEEEEFNEGRNENGNGSQGRSVNGRDGQGKRESGRRGVLRGAGGSKRGGSSDVMTMQDSGRDGSRSETARQEEPGIRSVSRERERRAVQKGLEQTAASRDKGRDKVKERMADTQMENQMPGENWMKDLKPEDLKVLGDILKEYLG